MVVYVMNIIIKHIWIGNVTTFCYLQYISTYIKIPLNVSFVYTFVFHTFVFHTFVFHTFVFHTT